MRSDGFIHRRSNAPDYLCEGKGVQRPLPLHRALVGRYDASREAKVAARVPALQPRAAESIEERIHTI